MDDGAGHGDDGALPPLVPDARVDRIMAVLGGLDDLPVAEHADVYLEVHARLSSELNPERTPGRTGTHGAP